MATPQILYIRLDENYEPDFASSKAGLITDIEAVAQAILTRLRLLQGEWWENPEKIYEARHGSEDSNP